MCFLHYTSNDKNIDISKIFHSATKEDSRRMEDQVCWIVARKFVRMCASKVKIIIFVKERVIEKVTKIKDLE